MSKTQPSSEYERYWVDWGRSLLLKYPNGLGKEPDFAHDGTALIVWSVDGFIKHQEAMWKVGQLVDVPIGGRVLKSIQALSRIRFTSPTRLSNRPEPTYSSHKRKQTSWPKGIGKLLWWQSRERKKLSSYPKKSQLQTLSSS
jgi:hypothetical protein